MNPEVKEKMIRDAENSIQIYEPKITFNGKEFRKEELDKLVDVRQFVGLAPVQTEEYVKVIKTVLSNYDIENEGFGKVNV